MDWIRSCYRSSMRLFPDRPDVLTTGRWYFAPAGAKVIPYVDSFVSSNWDKEPLDRPAALGEYAVLDRWTDGAPPPRYIGQNWCGAAGVWRDGVPYAERGLPPVDAQGYPTCCKLGPAPTPDFCLLCEDGSDLLLEDGSGCIEYEH